MTPRYSHGHAETAICEKSRSFDFPPTRRRAIRSRVGSRSMGISRYFRVFPAHWPVIFSSLGDSAPTSVNPTTFCDKSLCRIQRSVDRVSVAGLGRFTGDFVRDWRDWRDFTRRCWRCPCGVSDNNRHDSRLSGTFSFADGTGFSAVVQHRRDCPTLSEMVANGR